MKIATTRHLLISGESSNVNQLAANKKVAPST